MCTCGHNGKAEIEQPGSQIVRLNLQLNDPILGHNLNDINDLGTMIMNSDNVDDIYNNFAMVQHIFLIQIKV